MRHPLKAVMDIRREELPLALLMFAYFFLVITSFWILKPLKKTLFIGYYKLHGVDVLSLQLTASQAELIAKVMNMLVAIAAVTVFSWLARRYRREQLTYMFSGLFLFGYVAYSVLLVAPSDAEVWSFYLFGDLYSTLMVATFFAFLNDSVTVGKAKRLYGLVGLGGVVGGAFGSLIVRVWIDRLSLTVWLWVTVFIALVIIVIAMIAGRLVRRDFPEIDREEPVSAPAKPRANPAIEGAMLVFRSPYLLSIVGIVGLYEIVSTVLDFQFTATVEHYVPREQIGEHFTTVYTITNFVAMFVQLFLTSFVMSRAGIKTALLVLPIAIITVSCGYLAVPILWMGSLLNTADNGLNYSINQSAKEALYVPTSRDEKYKAKAFIDMFVYRFAKALAVGVSLGITLVFTEFSGIRWLSIFVLLIMVIWIYAIHYAGKRFEELTDED